MLNSPLTSLRIMKFILAMHDWIWLFYLKPPTTFSQCWICQIIYVFPHRKALHSGAKNLLQRGTHVWVIFFAWVRSQKPFFTIRKVKRGKKRVVFAHTKLTPSPCYLYSPIKFFVTHSLHAWCFFSPFCASRKNVFMLIWKTEKVHKKVLVPQTFGAHGITCYLCW